MLTLCMAQVFFITRKKEGVNNIILQQTHQFCLNFEKRNLT